MRFKFTLLGKVALQRYGNDECHILVLRAFRFVLIIADLMQPKMVAQMPSQKESGNTKTVLF
jgi:hypothetical protein